MHLVQQHASYAVLSIKDLLCFLNGTALLPKIFHFQKNISNSEFFKCVQFEQQLNRINSKSTPVSIFKAS